MANLNLNEHLEETLEQIAALCPLRHFRNASSDENIAMDNHEPCSIHDFEVNQHDQGAGHYFACRKSQDGVCAGFVEHRAENQTVMEHETAD